MPNPAPPFSIAEQHRIAHVLVNAEIADHLVAWANIVALTCADARFDRFREDVTEALRSCVRKHVDAPLLAIQHKKTRERYAAMASAAKAAEEKLRARRAIPAAFPPLLGDYPLFLAEDALKREAEAVAEAARQPTGRPRKMQAFEALALGLMQAFQNATGQPAKITWREHRDCYEGMFFELVEEILTTARDVAEAVTGRPLQVPSHLRGGGSSPTARGKFLQRLIGRTEDKTPP
jgi:hypothetical protein